MLETKKVLGISFVHSNMNQLTDELHERIKDSKKTFVVTANPEILKLAGSQPSYKKTIQSADYVIPDGIGVIVASKLVGSPLHERLAGFDLMTQLLSLANDHSYRVFFLGAKPEVIEDAVHNIKKKYPHIDIAGYHHGYIDENDQSVVNEIQKKEVDLVFVGVGFPKQEEWIANHLSQFKKGIFIGVGGSFDVWANRVKRAPKVWQALNIEWLYRLIKQPSRWKRILNVFQFIFDVFFMKLTGQLKK